LVGEFTYTEFVTADGAQIALPNKNFRYFFLGKSHTLQIRALVDFASLLRREFVPPFLMDYLPIALDTNPI
jgi:hypothetical protein